jgi:hypothetical protein
VDRRKIARAQRRRQALEALEFERARTVMLQEQLETIVAELDGPAIDESIFAGMAPEDVEVVRPAVQSVELEGPQEEWLPAERDLEQQETENARLEEEIDRLQSEIAGSRRRQKAFERYLDALDD